MTKMTGIESAPKIKLSLGKEDDKVFFKDESGEIVSPKCDEIVYLSADGQKALVGRLGDKWFLIEKSGVVFVRKDGPSKEGYAGLRIQKQTNISLGGESPDAIMGDPGTGVFNHIVGIWGLPSHFVPSNYELPSELENKGFGVGTGATKK